MFIQIAPKAKVYITEEDYDFLAEYWSKTFRGSHLPIVDQDRAKKLADKAVLVRKKLDNDVQYQLNKKIRVIHDSKRSSKENNPTSRLEKR
tara:strand:+ start:251 stop:523 length:273 start_codon:yes stop_codon:yes gene_type:complete